MRSQQPVNDAIRPWLGAERESTRKVDEGLFERFMRHLPGFAWLKEASGKFVYVNDAMAKAFGISAEQALDKSDADLSPPSFARQYQENDAAAIQSEGGIRLVESYLHADGSTRTALVSKFPVMRHDGATLVGGIAIDITDRMRAEDGLRRSEERLRLATGTGKVGVWDWDIATDRVNWTGSLYAMLGLTHEQFDGTIASGLALVHPDDRAAVRNTLRRALDGEHGYEIEFRALRPDGATLWMYTNAEVIREHGKPVRLVGATLDITRRKQMEIALRENEERMRLALHGAHAGAWVYGADPQIAFWSPEFRELFGFTPDTPSTLDALSERVHPDDRAQMRSQFTELLRSGQGEFRQEFRITHPQLGLRWMLTLGRIDRDGEAVHCHGISLDITRAKQVEDELRTQDQRKNEFLATLAHELRNPLAPIRNGLEVLRLTHDSGAMAEQARDMMERQLRQMVRLIDDLLDLSRISRGKIELKRERIELQTIVRTALEVSRPLIEQAGHHLTLDLAPEPLCVDADATRLAQVFANLLNNAAKYTNDGGHIRVRLLRDGAAALVSVQDDGIGIPPQMLPRVFDMFTQVDRSLEKAQGGLGIGLSISRQLIEMHGGTIEARSEGPGKGSEFRVRVPLSHARPDAEAVRDAAPLHITTGLRILVADDNIDAAQTLAMMLTLNGNDVRTARDGIEAIAVAKSFLPQVILLDIGMPRLNGYDACRQIRRVDALAKCLIVATTGWGQDEDMCRSREAGFDHHLVKPVEASALEALLAREFAIPR